MLSPRANAARAPNSTARQFSTGNAPGKPRHTGQVFEFGSSPNRVEQPQKIFDSVLSWAWTSSPMMVSQLFVIGQLSLVSCQLSVVSCQLSVVRLASFLTTDHGLLTTDSSTDSSTVRAKPAESAHRALHLPTP